MTALNFVLMFLAASFAGAINSIAGGGALIVFPTLLFVGLSPITANATSNTAMFLGTLASVGGYLAQIKPHKSIVMKLSVASLLGSVIGAVLLLTTPETMFFKLVPFLILTAALLFTFGNRLAGYFREGDSPVVLSAGALLGQFVISIYGGYFGAGQGFAILALLMLIGFKKIHEMNGVKSFLAACINGIAVVPFVIAGAIAWPHAIVLSAGAILGGFIGARSAQKVNPRRVRKAVLVLAYAMTIYFFWKVYGSPNR